MSANAQFAGGTWSSFRGMPLWPLAATLAVQTLATMALFSVPAAAPEIARELGVPGALSGVFVSIVYTVGIASALISPGFVHRYGAVRVSQVVLLAVLGMLAAAAGGSLGSLALGAVVLGLAYGAIAPASTHLLVPQTPPPVFNLVMSLRQIGVPLGGVLGAIIVPRIVVGAGWRAAMLAELMPALVLLVLMELPRRTWDADRSPGRRLWSGTLLQPWRLLRDDRRLRPLSLASFVFSGVQLCFIAFMTVQLTAVVRLGLIQAGMALAAYQVAGAVSRPVWGWVGDRFLSPARMLALLGFGMAITTLAAGWLGPSWPWAGILGVALLGGATAGGYTGLAYAEYARLGGTRRTEATGLGTAVMFAGVTIFPSAFGAAISVLGGYAVADAVLATLAAVAAALLCRTPEPG
ncbi:MAG TPA: MFS transporter [Acetobacteraceae bacterium]